MFPTCSKSGLAGRKALSATIAPSTGSPTGAGNGHPPETFTRHQPIGTPSGADRGA